MRFDDGSADLAIDAVHDTALRASTAIPPRSWPVVENGQAHAVAKGAAR
jgi:hypothetical protein